MAKQDLWKKKEEELGVKLSAGDIFRAETAMQPPSVRELTPKEIIQSDFKPIEGMSAADSVRIGLNVSDWKNEIKTTRAPAAVSALIPNEVQKTPGRAMAFFMPAKAKGVFREKDKAALEHAQEMVDTYSKLRGSYTTSREEKQEANRQVQYFQGEVDRLTDKLYGEEIAKLESQKETYKAEYEAAKAAKEKSDKYVYGKLNSGQPLTAAEKAEREKVLERFEKAKENYVPGGWFQGAFQQVGGAFANVLPTAVELGNEAKRADAKPLSPVDTGDPEMDAYLAQIGGAADKAVARPEGALLDDKEIQSWQQKADELTERGQYRIEMSKAGTSKAEQTLIDIGVGATQLLGDIALGTATGVGVMPVMAIRSFGGGAQEARQNGANVQQQFLYGIASAGVEVITEKIFGGPQLFQKAYGAGFLDNVVNKLTKKLTTKSGQVTWLTAKSFLEEGSEEFIASIVNPFISTIYKEDALKEAYGNGDAFLTTVTNALYDALIGGVLGFAGFAVNAKGEMRNLQQQVAMAELEKMVSIDKLGQEFGGEVSLMVKALTESQTYAEGTASRTLGRDLREALYELIDANDSAGVRNFFKANKAQFDKLLKVMTLESDKIVPAEQDPRRNGTLGELATQSEETQSEDSYSRVMDSTETKVYEALTAKGFSSGEATAVFEYVARIVDGDITLTNNDITERARVGKDPRIIEVINELTGSNLNVNEKSRSKVKTEVRDVIAKVAAAKEDARIAEAQQSAVADVEQMVAETRASIPLEQVFTPAQQVSPAAAPTVEPTAAEQSGADKFMAFAKGEAEAEIQPQSESIKSEGNLYTEQEIRDVAEEMGIPEAEATALIKNFGAMAKAKGIDPAKNTEEFIRYSVDEQVENYVNVGNITDEQKLARDILKASLADLGIKDVVLVTGDARMFGSNGSYVGGVVTINADRINTQTYSGIAWTVGHEIVHAAEDADGGRKANGVTVRNAKIVNDIFDVMRVLADAGAIEGRYAEITRDEKSLAALIDKKKNAEHRFLMRDWVDENGVFHKGMTKQQAERSFNDFDARAEIAADFLGSMLGHNFKHEREGRFGSKFGTSDIFAMMEETAPETTSWIHEKINSIRDRLRGYDAKTAAERKAKATMQRHLTKLSKELAEAISKGAQKNAAQTSDVRNAHDDGEISGYNPNLKYYTWEKQVEFVENKIWDTKLRGNGFRRSVMYVMESPTQLLQQIGFEDYPLVTTVTHYENMRAQRWDANGNVINQHNHELSRSFTENIPKYIDEAVAIFKSDTKYSPGGVVILTPEVDAKGDPVTITLTPNQPHYVYDGEQGAAHFVNAFGRANFDSFISGVFKNGNVIYVDKKRAYALKSQRAAKIRRHIASSGIKLDTIIQQKDPSVNTNLPPRRFSVDDSDGNTLSAEQQEYFKDSKVRDKGGRLKVMYHGTQSFGFSIFDPSYSDDGRSLFFTDSPYTAESYSGTLRDRSLLVDELDPYEAPIREVVEKYNEIFHENARAVSTPEVMEATDKLIERNRKSAESVVSMIEKFDVVLGKMQELEVIDEAEAKAAKDAATAFETVYRAMARANGKDNLLRAAELMEMVASSGETRFSLDNMFYRMLPNDAWPIMLAQNAREAAKSVGWDRRASFVKLRGRFVSEDFIRGTVAEQMQDSNVGNYKVYLNITNPLEINANGAAWNEILVPKPIRDDFISSSPRGEYLRGAVEQLKGQIAEWEAELAVAEEAQKSFVRDQISYVTGELNAVYGELDSLKYTTTRELSEYAQRKGYDGVLINDVFDMGEELYDEEYSNIAIAFSSEQVKDIYNTEPTTNPDIRYSVDDTLDKTAESEYSTISNSEEAEYGREESTDNRGRQDSGRADNQPHSQSGGERYESGGRDGRGDMGGLLQQLKQENSSIPEKVRKIMTDKGIPNVELTETTDRGAFSAALDAAKTANPNGGMVDPQSAEELRKHGSRTFMRTDSNAGVAIEKDGNIVGVFKNPEYKERGAVYDLILTAIANGGNHLDCYATYAANDLRAKYAKMGFKPVCWLEFSREAANPDWNYEAWGEPDVVLWVHNGDAVEQIVERTERYHVPTREEIHALPKFEDYDEAKAYQAQKVEEMVQSKARAETLSKLFRYSVDDTIEAPVKKAEAPTEPELTPQQIRERDRAEALRRVFTTAREIYGDNFEKMSEDVNTKAGLERLSKVFRPAASQAQAEQRTRDDLRLQREREREAERRREMRKAFNLEKQDIRKEEREKARVDKMAALAVQEQRLDDKWKARMEAKVETVKAQAEERLRIKMRKADFIRAYENLAAEIREKKAKAEGKRKAAEERRRGNERISEQRVLSRTTAKEARRVLSQSRNTDRPDYTNSEVETLRQLRPDDVSTEQVTTLADKLRNARKRLYRVFVNQAQTIDNFSKLQIDGIRAGSLVNMIFGSASTIETIYQNGLVARDGTRLGDAMKEVFLVRNADGSIDQEKQAILQDYMLFVHNIDRMSFSERALARVEAMEAQHPWLVDIGAKEFAYAAGLNDAETEATGTEERRTIVREYAKALADLRKAQTDGDKPIFADKDGKPVSAETSREIVARYEEEHPWLKEKAEGIYEWWDSFMREWAVGNTLSAEAYDTWKQMYPHYVPTYRANDGGPEGAIQIGPASASINDLYKAAKGSTKPVKNIEESFSTLVRKIVDTSRKNELLRNIIDTAMLDTEGVFGDFAIFDWDGYYESNPEYGEAMENAAWLNGDSISAVESAHVEAIEELDGGYRITAYGMDGGRYSAWVSKEMYRALVAVTNPSKLLGEGANTLTRFGSKLTTPAKSMITGYNPNFAMRNVVRDLQTAFVNGISGVAFPKYYARALAQIKGNSEAWQQFQALGGTHFGYYGMSTDWAARMEKKPGTAAKVKDKLGAFSEITESATRFAEYLATIDKLGDTYEGRVQGIKNAAEVTVDFSRKGEYGKLANAWIPYWNPAVQGIDKLFRQIFDNSTSVKQKFAVSGVTLTRGAIIAVLPELLQYLLLKATDRYDDWEKLSDRMKDSYFCIPLLNEHKFLKIPKTREWGTLLGTPLMRMLEGFNGRSDPFENYVEDALLANFSVPGVGDAIGIGTLIDLWTNKDFAGRDIVPYAYQDAPASLQYDADTSVIAYGAATAWNKSFAKIAEALGMEVELSPMQLDYILNDYCGDFYYTLVEMVPVGLFDGSTSLKEVYNGILSSMKSTWVGDNRYSNYYTGEYYDILDYLDRNIAGEKLMNPEDYTNSYVFKLDKAFNEAYGKQLSELNKQAAQLPDGEEKDAIKEQIADLAFEAVEWFRNETINNSDDPFLRVSYGDFSTELQDALIDLDGFSGDYYFKPSPSTSKSYTDPHNKGKEYVLTEEQYAQYKTFYMEAYDEIMTQAVKSYQYKRLSDEEKAEYLDEARDAVHEKAKEELFTWLRRNGVKSTYKAD